jgi:hypothetical protein
LCHSLVLQQKNQQVQFVWFQAPLGVWGSRSIPTLIEYLMLDSRQVYVELWRKENGKWVLTTETSDVNERVELKSIENDFSLQDFYYRALELMKEQEEQLR